MGDFWNAPPRPARELPPVGLLLNQDSHWVILAAGQKLTPPDNPEGWRNFNTAVAVAAQLGLVPAGTTWVRSPGPLSLLVPAV